MASAAPADATVRASLLEGGAVLRVLLDQPRANVLSMRMMGEIAGALDAHRGDRALKLVVLRGAGGNFSYGASVPEHRPETAAAMLAAFHDLVRKVAAYPVPVAALVEGRCLGGAFELVLACHLVFVAPTAELACPEIKLGVLPPVLAVLGHQRLGAPLAERMILTGASLGAGEACACGLATAVPATDGDAEEWLMSWYRSQLAPLSAFALREATQTVRQASGMLASLDAPLAAAEKRYVERVATSHDGREGIEAFLAKRAPQWADA